MMTDGRTDGGTRDRCRALHTDGASVLVVGLVQCELYALDELQRRVLFARCRRCRAAALRRRAHVHPPVVRAAV